MKTTHPIFRKKVSLSSMTSSTWLFLSLLISTMIHINPAQTQTPDKILKEILQEDNIEQTAKRLTMANQAELESMQRLIRSKELHDIFQQKIKDTITPGDRMRGYRETIDRWLSEGKSMDEICSALFNTPSALKKGMAVGSISGTVTIQGGAWIWGTVQVYDEFGILSGFGTIDGTTGTYTVQDLLPGNYFVLTTTSFIDEFYDDIVSENNFENWRQVIDGGHLVQVLSGADTPNIDFELQTGAIITGMVYEADGVTPINIIEKRPTFKLTRADSEVRLLIPSSTRSSNGDYTLRFPHIGDLKLSVTIDGYLEEYYDDKSDWASADPITINSVNDEVQGIDFSMEPGVMPPVPGPGAIAGFIRGPAGFPAVGFGLVVAFNAADTSIAGFTWGARLDGGGYIIPNLAPGEYLLYADDTRGNLMGASNLVGAYYDNAPTPDLATPVTVVADDTTENIDFELALAGGIEGNLVNDEGTPLDSSFVFAVNADLISLENGLPFSQPVFSMLGNLWFDVGITDATGHYILDGLPTGNYIVRTLTINGPHANTVLGEYYDDVQDIFNIFAATSVSVTAPLNTTGIDFILDRGGSISGTVYDADGITPVENAVVLAMVESTGFPAIMLPGTSDETGSFTVSPLPTGDYKLIVVPDGNVEPFYVVEFYDGVFNIDDATTISVTAPEPITDINFTLAVGGFIHGIVNLSPAYRTGIDTLSGFPVITYNAITGDVADVTTVTFAGGYRTGQLLAGPYKVAAMPAVDGWGVSYHGGGQTYYDAATTDVVVIAGDSTRADITLIPGTETISGTVQMRDTGIPIVSIVMAHDTSGHAVSFSMSGTDRTTGEAFPSPGDYVLYGIRPGGWYVRTWSFFGIINMLENPGNVNAGLAKSTFLNGWPLPIDMVWENTILDPTKDYNIFGLLSMYSSTSDGIRKRVSKLGKIQGPSSGYCKCYVPKCIFPWWCILPDGESVDTRNAKKSSPHSTLGVTGIDFFLPDLRSFFSEVTEEGNIQPIEFSIEQNHPNPFNPETTIRYHLKHDTRVEMSILNVLGQKIAILVSEFQTQGIHQVQWNGMNDHGRPMPSGVYIYQIKAGEFTDSRRLILLR